MKKYKLIKEYPGSPELGTIMIEPLILSYTLSGDTKEEITESDSANCFNEFWEEIIEPVKQDYEILSFININTKIEVVLHDNGLYCSTTAYQYTGQGKLTLKDCLSEKCLAMHKVKRFDGEIFTVGDKIIVGENKVAVIGDFSFMGYGDTRMWVHYRDLDGTHRGSSDISNIKHSKKLLFTTVDGVDIYEGDEYFYVYLWEITNRKALPGNYLDIDNYYFSTREKAEEYIYWNEPVLSLNEVATIYKGLTYLKDNTPQKPGQQALDLLELVKSKYE
jgi:hypothetical protein